MFRNPLKKYQQGGAAPTQKEQQMLAAFIEWLPKRVKEFEGMQPEAIAQALDGMSKTAEGQKQVQQLMEQFQQEMQSSQSLRQGGKIHDFICKHAKGGYVAGCDCKQDGGLIRAKNYYNNHANEGVIRKIQNFLSGKGYDLGDAGIDGRFGQKTYDAIRQYQRDNGLVDDGMWGEDTNSVHRVLGAGDTTFNGPRSGAHPGTHTYTEDFVNQPYDKRQAFKDANDQRAYLNDVTSRAYANPEWFWGDTDDASAARQYLFNLRNNGKSVGEDFIRDLYYNWTSPELQRTIDYKKLPKDISVDRTVATQRENTNRAAKDVAVGAGALAGTLLAAEAIPLIADYAPSVINGIKTGVSNGVRGYWNPAQARVGTFFRRIPNGSVMNNINGQFVSNAGMNMGQFTSGTDFAATIANNLRAITPYGFKEGGKIEKGQEGLPIAKNAKAGRKAATRNTVKAADDGIAKNRRVGAALDRSGGQHVYEDSTIRGSWADTWASVPTPGDTIVIQKFPTAKGNDVEIRQYPMGSEEYDSVMNRMRPLFEKFFKKDNLNVLEPIPGTGLFPGTRKNTIKKEIIM